MHVHKVMPYNCTNVVPVLPARMAIFSDSCSLWKKSGHIEDETHKKLVGASCRPYFLPSLARPKSGWARPHSSKVCFHAWRGEGARESLSPGSGARKQAATCA